MKFQFTTIFDLIYHLFIEMGLGIDKYDNHVYNQDDLSPLAYNGKIIKASVSPEPLYPGKDDIIFDIYNFGLVNKLFHFYLDKIVSDPEANFVYVADFVEDEDKKRIFKEDRLKQRVVVRTSNRGDIKSEFYNYLCLGYIDAIFKINENIDVDLSNFDIIEDIKC